MSNMKERYISEIENWEEENDKDFYELTEKEQEAVSAMCEERAADRMADEIDSMKEREFENRISKRR